MIFIGKLEQFLEFVCAANREIYATNEMITTEKSKNYYKNWNSIEFKSSRPNSQHKTTKFNPYAKKEIAILDKEIDLKAIDINSVTKLGHTLQVRFPDHQKPKTMKIVEFVENYIEKLKSSKIELNKFFVTLTKRVKQIQILLNVCDEMSPVFGGNEDDFYKICIAFGNGQLFRDG